MKLFLTVLACTAVLSMQAQTARIQFIHNTADLALDTIDIYIGDSLWLDNFAFRTASPFADLTTDVQAMVGIAPKTSTSSVDAFAFFPEDLLAGEAYIAVLNGQFSATGYSPATPLTLDIYTGALETSEELTGTEVLVLQGSSDAGSIDLVENELLLLTAIEDLSYGQFSGYISLPSANYHFAVKDDEGNTTFGDYAAPLAALGYGGKAVTILTNGFRSPLLNSGGAGFGLWVAEPLGGPLVALPASTVRMQLIHNSADVAVDTVDVYANEALIANNLAFHTATPFLELAADPYMHLAFAPASSTNASEALAVFNVNSTAGEKYIGVLNGIYSVGGYDPVQPLSLNIYSGAREAATDQESSDLLVVQGSTDAALMDLEENTSLNATLVNDLLYGTFDGYNTIVPADLALDIADADGDEITATYSVPLLTWELAGAAITIVVGGFTDPGVNSDGIPFGLWMATASGGDLLPLPQVIVPTLFARVQLIHNSADAMLSQVDIYRDDVLLADDMDFISALPFNDIPTNCVLSVANASSISADDAFASFELMLAENETYILVMNGIGSTNGYNPAPALALHVFEGAREESAIPGTTDVLMFHGSTDFPALDCLEDNDDQQILVEDLSYGNFSGYMTLDSENHNLYFVDHNNTIALGNGVATLDLLQDEALVILPAGFYNPLNNSNGPSLTYWMVHTDGSMEQMPACVGLNDIERGQYFIYPNPATNQLFVSGISASASQCDILNALGQVVKSDPFVAGQSGASREMSTRELSEGVYYLRILSDQDNELIRFTIIR